MEECDFTRVVRILVSGKSFAEHVASILADLQSKFPPALMNNTIPPESSLDSYTPLVVSEIIEVLATIMSFCKGSTGCNDGP